MLGLFWLAALVWPPPDAYSAAPAGYGACRIFQRPLSQGDCGACSAFAVSTWIAMHRCLAEGVDEIPSPYRLFDCAGGVCERGMSVRTAMLAPCRWDVGDIESTAKRFGLPCDAPRPSATRMWLSAYAGTSPALRSALWWQGPLLGVVDPRSQSFSEMEAAHNLSHAVVVVGWTRDGWLIQNSWGSAWGDTHGRGVIPWEGLEVGFRPVYLSKRAQLVIVLASFLITCAGAYGFLVPPKKAGSACRI